LAALEGIAAVVTASGTAAIANVIGFTESGDHIVASSSLYGGLIIY
jgi:O-acetylhomoserine/O-acetylserine sulfhydrylase-like pyridoxal-dependent enzyme